MNIDRPHIAPRPPSAAAPPATAAPSGATTSSAGAAVSAAGASRPQAAPPPVAMGEPTRLQFTQGDFDAQRVAALRESVRQGTYTPRLERVADGLLSQMQSVGLGRRP